MAKRFIDATDWDSFYKDMGDSRNTMDSYDMGYTDALDNVDDWMDAQPTVDAVEVVRCKNCKHWIHLENGTGDCTNRRFYVPGVADITMNAEEFCCLVERKDNGI